MVHQLLRRAAVPGRTSLVLSSRGPRIPIPIPTPTQRFPPVTSLRQLHVDHRNRLSRIWIPPSLIALKDAKEDENIHTKLVRAGFLRQAHSGIFHMLPLGCRVQDKIEALINKHMQSIGASRLSLSSISSQELWKKSGRYTSVASELFCLADRRGTEYLLSPTHEEEITELVTQNVKSYKFLPLRLYQITRKYRDEKRPRHGLLRSREFTMKDLYTFDVSQEAAMETYAQVREAYGRLFAELKVPVLVAEASSGDMGGDLSHEYHLPSSLGEDYVASCGSCGFVANAEIIQTAAPAPPASSSSPSSTAEPPHKLADVAVWRGISKDGRTLVNVWYPRAVADPSGGEAALSHDDINVQAVKSAVPDLNSSIEDPTAFWAKVLEEATAATAETATKPKLVNLVDSRLVRSSTTSDLAAWAASLSWPRPEQMPAVSAAFEVTTRTHHPHGSDTTTTGAPLNFIRARTGDPCPRCAGTGTSTESGNGTLTVHRAIELGHTFHLGRRYTDPWGASVSVPSSSSSDPNARATLEMGCHGIGISRIVGAVADHLSDARGLGWPRAIAPYEVAVLPQHRLEEAGEEVYDRLVSSSSSSSSSSSAQPIDAVLDDRPSQSLAWKLKDADLVGYPVVVVVGNAWREGGVVEVQCRRLGVRARDVALADLPAFVRGLLEQL